MSKAMSKHSKTNDRLDILSPPVANWGISPKAHPWATISSSTPVTSVKPNILGFLTCEFRRAYKAPRTGEVGIRLRVIWPPCATDKFIAGPSPPVDMDAELPL